MISVKQAIILGSQPKEVIRKRLTASIKVGSWYDAVVLVYVLMFQEAPLSNGNSDLFDFSDNRRISDAELEQEELKQIVAIVPPRVSIPDNGIYLGRTSSPVNVMMRGRVPTSPEWERVLSAIIQETERDKPWFNESEIERF